MGVHPTIKANSFPKQGDFIGLIVEVCFHYDTTMRVKGVIVRADIEDPWQTIIRLDDERHVLATECHFSLLPQDWKANDHEDHPE